MLPAVVAVLIAVVVVPVVVRVNNVSSGLYPSLNCRIKTTIGTSRGPRDDFAVHLAGLHMV